MLAVLATHKLVGTPYPWSRTGLYLIWLFLLASVAAWNWAAHQQTRQRWLAPFFLASLVVVLVPGVAGIQARYYFDFRDDKRR